MCCVMALLKHIAQWQQSPLCRHPRMPRRGSGSSRLSTAFDTYAVAMIPTAMALSGMWWIGFGVNRSGLAIMER